MSEFPTSGTSASRNGTPARCWRRSAIVLAAAATIYAAAGFFVLPALVRDRAPAAFHDLTGAELVIAELRFNPFLLTIDARGIGISGADGAPIASLSRLFVDLDMTGLATGAWTFSELRIEEPEFDVIRDADGTTNLASFTGLSGDEGTAEPAPGLRVVEAAVTGARLRYKDLRPGFESDLEFGPADLSASDLTTLPARAGGYRLQAALPGGAELEWSGSADLQALALDGKLQISGFQPAASWSLVQPFVRLRPPEGRVDMSLRYTAKLDGDRLALNLDGMEGSIRELSLQASSASKPLLGLDTIEFSGGAVDLGARSISLEHLRFADGALAARLDRAGALDWGQLLVTGSSTEQTAADADELPWHLQLSSVELAGIRAEVLDSSRLSPLGLKLLAQRTDFAASLTLGADDVQALIERGSADLADIEVSTGTGEARERAGRIRKLAIEAAGLDLAAQRLSAKRIAVNGLETSLHRESDGRLREIARAATHDAAHPLPISSAAAAWHLSLDELAVTRANVEYTDAVSAPPVVIATRDASVRVTQLNTGVSEPLLVTAEIPLASGGKIGIDGSVAGDASSARLQLTASELVLSPLAPLVRQRTRLALDSGTLSTDATIDYRQGEGGEPVLQTAASLGIDGLRLSEQESGARFLEWRSMAASGIDFGLAPDRLQVREVRLVEPGATLVIDKDRSTNFSGLLRSPGAAAPDDAAADSSLPVLIDRVRFDRAQLDFSDLGLLLPFGAKIEQLSGTARGVSSDEQSRATLKLAGRVGEFGEAEIDGHIAPFHPDHYTDIEVSFRNIAMGQLTPYSATFAGRKIASGDLDLGLEYQISEGKLTGNNQMVLQDFRLGESVKSPQALDLPLDLAIALLTDADGRIEMSVPLSGNVEDPRFNFGTMAGKALRTAISNIVAAPFRALGSLLGAAARDGPPAIRFLSGSTLLMPRERERLAQLAAALEERPQLGVVISPGIEPERDGYAARRLLVRRAHAALLDLELEEGEDPGAVSYDAARSQRALERLMDERDGEGAADAFAASRSAGQGGEVHRVNAALALLGRGAGDPAYYRELYLHLVNSTPEPRDDLARISAGRVASIRAELEARGVDPGRIRVGPGKALQQAKPTGVLVPIALQSAVKPKKTATKPAPR